MADFTKLKDLVGDMFTITKAYGYTWKTWDNATNKMLTSPSYEKGYKKSYAFDTDKGRLELGPGQLGNLLEGVYAEGRADINGRTFSVKSNGKTGIDIRYYLNPVKPEVVVDIEDGVVGDVGMEDIPF